MAEQFPDFQKLIAEARAKARRLRCEAFVEYSPVVAGQRLRPITLDTYNELLAFENAFVTGGAPGFEDIFGFIWIHHPDFGQFAAKARRRCLRQVMRALEPRWPIMSMVARVLAPLPRFGWLRGWIEPTPNELATEAAEEINRLLTEALCDFPSGSGDGEPLPFGLQAQILNLMRRELQIPFAETRRIPLKQLAQHLREIVHTNSQGKALQLTAEEAAIWRAYLASLQPAPAPAKP